MDRLTERTGEGQAIPRMDLKSNGHQKCMERLAEYEDLEEQGKLLKLPCTVGDTVHIIDDIENEFERTSIVTGIEIEEENEVYIMVSDGFQSGSSSSFGVDDFGKTVFLTREEAEATLEELERG